jgi:hypothetical protein
MVIPFYAVCSANGEGEDKYSANNPLAWLEHLPQDVPTLSEFRKSFIEHAPVLEACLISLSVTSLHIQTYIGELQNK